MKPIRDAGPELARLKAELQAARMQLGAAMAALTGRVCDVQDPITDLVSHECGLSQRLAYAEGLRRVQLTRARAWAVPPPRRWG